MRQRQRRWIALAFLLCFGLACRNGGTADVHTKPPDDVAKPDAAESHGTTDAQTKPHDHGPQPDAAEGEAHPIVASPSPEHYSHNPLHNGDTFDYGTREIDPSGSTGWGYQIRFWNASDQPLRVSNFTFEADPTLDHQKGWVLTSGDTLWVDNLEPHSVEDTIELKPEQLFRINVNFGYNRSTPTGDHVATMSLQSDPGGEYEVKLKFTLKMPAAE